MSDSCPFLENGLSKRGLLCCAAGVNFYAVGQACELCRLCPLSGNSWTPTCEFLEVYTFVHREEEERRIEVRFDCWSPEGKATRPRCATCPAAGAPLSQGNETPEAQFVQTIARHPLGVSHRDVHTVS
jgi:hypothetical protein